GGAVGLVARDQAAAVDDHDAGPGLAAAVLLHREVEGPRLARSLAVAQVINYREVGGRRQVVRGPAPRGPGEPAQQRPTADSSEHDGDLLCELNDRSRPTAGAANPGDIVLPDPDARKEESGPLPPGLAKRSGAAGSSRSQGSGREAVAEN